MAKRMIYLNEQAESIWVRLFDESGKNASAWIHEMLLQEDKQLVDPYLIKKKLNELSVMKEKIESDLEELKKRLATIQSLPEDTISFEIDYVLLKNMAKGIMQTYGLEESKASKLAREYLSLGDEKPILQDFIRGKSK